MNIFRLAGDMTHLFSILVLLLKIYATKSCSGLSLAVPPKLGLFFILFFKCSFSSVTPSLTFLRQTKFPMFDFHHFTDCLELLFFRDFSQDSRAVRDCVRGTLFGSVHGLHIRLQHLHEGGVHCKLLSHFLVHAFSSHGQEKLR